MPPPTELLSEFSDVQPNDSLLSVRSTWNDVPKQLVEVKVGTEPRKLSEQQTQTTSRSEQAVQTDENAAAAASQGPSAAQKSSKGMDGFVARMEEMMAGELDKAVEEAEVLEPFTRMAASAAQEPATCLHFLTAFPQVANEQDMQGLGLGGGNANAARSGQGGKQEPAQAPLVVTSLSWSSTGQTIAASYGRFDIVGWCEQPGLLATWNIGKGEVSTTRPDAKVEVDNCLMTCAFHPTHPALIAGGTFTGEVYVWDMSKEGDPQVGRSDALLDVRHTEPVVSLAWQYNLTDANKYGQRSHAYRLVTLGADGRVLVWQWHKMDSPVYGYQLLHAAPGLDRKVAWGGTAMAFQRDPRGAGAGAGAGGKGAASSGKDKGGDAVNTFLVATEGGRLFRCYHDVSDLTAADWQKALTAGDKVDLRSPIKDATYTPHSGAAFGVDCSPFQRDLFLSCGADGMVRLYSALKSQPLLAAEPSPGYLYQVQWSPFRPLVFAVAAADGCAYIYDLAQVADGAGGGAGGKGGEGNNGGGGTGMLKPVVTMDANGMRKPCHAVAFNARKPELCATGDVTGVQIWRLPSSLTGARRGEEGVLRRVANAEDAGQALRTQLR